MKTEHIIRILEDTAYVRVGGSKEELTAAQYIQNQAKTIGMNSWLESFPVLMSKVNTAELIVDGISVPCKGYLCSGSSVIEAPLYYLRNTDSFSLSLCKDKIVLIDGYLGYWVYQDILKNGAVGFITYDGNLNYSDQDIDQRELRSYVHKNVRIPGININAKDAVALIERNASFAKIVLNQEETTGNSQNVVAELPGQYNQWIVLTAHYDSTSLSQGAYDNMSGCIGLLGIADRLKNVQHNYGLRFIWCGSEERGLLGSKAYCENHKDALESIVLNINLDMIGSIMGKFIYCVSAEEKLCHYIEYFAMEKGFGISGKQDVYSSDSTPFADNGVPAVSFARIAPQNTATIHNSYDTKAVVSGRQELMDIEFLADFTSRMADSVCCPVDRTIPDNIKQKLDEYLTRKRPSK